MAVIYRRLGTRAGGKSTRNQVIHVLAYGGIPMVASLAIWVLTALLAGEATFVETPRADVEGFLVLLLHVQFIAYVLLLIWSIVLQVMGFSEIQGLATRKAFGVWVLGQIIGFLASLFLALLIETLFPGSCFTSSAQTLMPGGGRTLPRRSITASAAGAGASARCGRGRRFRRRRLQAAR